MPSQTAGIKIPQYFMDMIEAEKHIKHCMSEIDMNNMSGATEFLKKAIELF